VLDKVGVVQASLLKGLLEVVCGQSRLTLATIYDSCGMNHDEATCLLTDAIIVGRGCDLLAAQLALLLAALGDLLDVMDDNIGRCFPAVAWGWVMLGHLVADGVLGDDAA
jgi:hypothetical protein